MWCAVYGWHHWARPSGADPDPATAATAATATATAELEATP